MADIYVPGVKSRFDTGKLVDDLMKVERVPKERAEKNVERLGTEKGWWQEVGSRLSSLRDSARLLYSFQNPFNDRIVSSSNEAAVGGTATREASEQERTFTVKQTAQADRFLSDPLDEKFTVVPGSYGFAVGKDEISFTFKGGSLREFVEALNRRGRDKVGASLVTVKQGTASLLIESKLTGEANRLVFKEDAAKLGESAGLLEKAAPSRAAAETAVVKAGTKTSIPLPSGAGLSPGAALKFETATEVRDGGPEREAAEPPPGPDIPSAGSVSHGGIVIENEPSSAPLPEWTPPAPARRVDDMNLLSLAFSDGTSAPLPALTDSDGFEPRQYDLSSLAAGKTVTALVIDNRNTHRDVSLRGVEITDPSARDGMRPKHPVSTAQDAVVSLEGIEITRPGNSIDDLIPGVTVTVRGASDTPVKLKIEPDRESIKDAVIRLVGNYNRLMAEINVLTRDDARVVDELSYLPKEEQDELKKRQGALVGDSTLSQVRGSLQRIAGSPYPTSSGRDLALLAQIGIGTDVRRGGAASGYDPSRLRGYLEIDEKTLDAALETSLPAVRELFGSDTNGDLIADSGVAYSLEALAKPYVETGGIISLKTSAVDGRITQEKRRIETLDRQLASREADLKKQYGEMEGAYNRMEQLSGSLDRFSEQQSSGGGNR
jgi:flagellar hook-associated protein 2